ncbi:hypothetical protein [Thiomicrospira sp. ALE5]|uniref:hypothetical protein n=1 Tax=Thiomicrospira sp. ALE5 TaxID=748650 RepID=UPI0008EFCC7F|nr:hypothetical protein [Thiomicrospira sp. ALE5]SFR53734.1 hypothetical protein SAMN03092900_0906 [Thiomicrospira sp. ALE5]
MNSLITLLSCNAQPNQAWLWQTEQAHEIEFGRVGHFTEHITAKAWHNQATADGRVRTQWLSDQAWLDTWQTGDLLHVTLRQDFIRPDGVKVWPQQAQIWLADRSSLAWVLAAAKERHQAMQAGLVVAPMIALLKHDPLLPVQLKPARFILELTESALGAVPLLEDWGVVNRVAHPDGLPGCYEGTLADLLADFVHHLPKQMPENQQAWYLLGQLDKADQQTCLNQVNHLQLRPYLALK